MNYVSLADIHLWSRCRRQWFRRRGESGNRRSALPEGMIGESSLREAARTAAYGAASGYESLPNLWQESIGRPDADPTIDAIDLVTDTERLERWWTHTAEALSTKRSFRSGVVLWEGLFVVVDVGIYRERLEAWEFSLFRAATGVRGAYRTDGGALALVLQGLGIPTGAIHLCYLNKKFRSGDTDEPVFLESNIATKSFKIRDTLRRDVKDLRKALDGEYQLPREYQCRDGCSLCVPAIDSEPGIYDVTTLHKGAQIGRELRKKGIVDLRDLSLDGVKLSVKQKIQVEAVRRGARYADGRRLEAFLDSLRYPLFFLDFEAYAPSVPSFQGLAPYEHIPVIASLHSRQSETATIEHDSFAARAGIDERAHMFAWLRERLGSTGSIVVFGKGFESSMISQLARVSDSSDDSDQLKARLVDLLAPFSDFSVYDPRQRGKVSLKRLLPVYTATGYQDEAVQDGMHANLSYGRRADACFLSNGVEHSEALLVSAAAAIAVDASYARHGQDSPVATIKEIIAYCSVDTIAMVRLLDRLGEIAGAETTWTAVID